MSPRSVAALIDLGTCVVDVRAKQDETRATTVAKAVVGERCTEYRPPPRAPHRDAAGRWVDRRGRSRS
jgi:hypothetical protein